MEQGYLHGVSAFEAKTHLSGLLRETERGQSFLIKRRGKAVARLVPPLAANPARDFVKLADAFATIRKGIGKKLNIRELIEEGRRY